MLKFACLSVAVRYGGDVHQGGLEGDGRLSSPRTSSSVWWSSAETRLPSLILRRRLVTVAHLSRCDVRSSPAGNVPG